jgi:hypothetical protein
VACSSETVMTHNPIRVRLQGDGFGPKVRSSLKVPAGAIREDSGECGEQELRVCPGIEGLYAEEAIVLNVWDVMHLGLILSILVSLLDLGE